ncbi:cell shape determining protein MreB [Spiroplasma sabaudiense Ar-1343]|uniref:Cell shape-determining protein MreB n=1 Tax=Spiroplasma sabaudiense Ar-1343 TaxID=1276257 RepID=W6AKQ0_9MOLU|nr:rod shape-determining protein [Spiroplasma sabaudiense]AHI54299.1 cell shape determining protein MreB [Spiroplasma sabaudiense Ar-1343]
MKIEEKQFIALDLGTSNVLAYVGKKGIVYNEPSIMAYDNLNNSLIALGHEAYEMVGKTNDNTRMVVPIKDGIIADMDAAKDLLKNIFGKLKMMDIWKNSVVLLACPSGVTELERDALKKVAMDLGADMVVVEEEIKLAAIGAGLNITLPRGSVAIDIGGGTTDVAIIASGEIITSRSIKAAGTSFDDDIKKYIRSEYNVNIGDKSAENIKIQIGSLGKYNAERSMSVFGRDVVSGLPKEAVVSAEEIRNVLINSFSKITDLFIELLEATPPELAGDIIKYGITICGGGALIRNVEKYFSDIFSIPCKIAKDPLMTVINGAKDYEKIIFNKLENGFYGKNGRNLKEINKFM